MLFAHAGNRICGRRGLGTSGSQGQGTACYARKRKGLILPSSHNNSAKVLRVSRAIPSGVKRYRCKGSEALQTMSLLLSSPCSSRSSGRRSNYKTHNGIWREISAFGI